MNKAYQAVRKQCTGKTVFFLFFLWCFFGVFEARAVPAIDRSETPVINGIKHYITIKGENTSAPILLFLHGGPGGSVMNEANRFTRELQQHFVVVQWDQRETGKTLELNVSPVPLTISLLQSDTKEMVLHLLKQFGKQKLYLAAYSWGTVPGFYIADQFPELLSAYIAISPIIQQYKSEQMTLDMLKDRAEQSRNAAALTELSQVKIPFENGKQLYYARKWLFTFDGNPIRNADTANTIRIFEQWSATWLAIWNATLQLDRFKEIPALKCPVYFLLGRKDHQTQSTIAEKYYQSLDAKKKKLCWFERSGHTIINQEPDLLQQTIIKEILPETRE